MMSQLNFLQSFVEDLLDLRIIWEGNFIMDKDVFQPAEIFKLITDVFSPQAIAKGIKLQMSYEPELRLPEEMRDFYQEADQQS